MLKSSAPVPPLRLNSLFSVTLNASVLVPPCKSSKPLKVNVFEPSLYVGLPPSAQVLARLLPVSVPLLPVRVFIPLKLRVISVSVPAKPSASEPVNTTASIRRPCSTSAPTSPSIEPVKAASMSKVSMPTPPLRLNSLATVTLNASVFVPPCKSAKPPMFNAGLAVLSSYVGVPSSNHVLAVLLPVSVPLLPVRVPIPSKSPTISVSVPSKPSPSEPVNSTAVIKLPCSTSAPASPSIEPFSAASMSKVSAPVPPLRLNVLAVVTLNVSVSVPPCKSAKPLKVNVSLPSLYVEVAPSAHVLVAMFSPVSVPPSPVIVDIPAKPAVISTSVPEKPRTPSDPVRVTASIKSP